MTDTPRGRGPDPLDVLATELPVSPPDPTFTGRLRQRLVIALELRESEVPTVRLSPRRDTVSTTTPATAAPATALTPYLCVRDAAAAIDFYVRAFGAVEQMRVVGDDGRIGHAELAIGDVRLYLSDEYEEMGVLSPAALGGSGVTLHLDVTDVDGLHAAVVAAGAVSLSPPTDQPHGARHGTVRDPFGHRWMLSQQVERVGADEYARRIEGSAYTVETEPGRVRVPEGEAVRGGIWAAINAVDAPAMIDFLVDVVGFERQLVVPGAEPDLIEHSQLVWPEGGVVQVATANRPGNMFSQRAVGEGSLYVITADPLAVHARCVEAGVEIVAPPSSPDYDPTGTGFTIRDAEGNLWTFGTYGGG